MNFRSRFTIEFFLLVFMHRSTGAYAQMNCFFAKIHWFLFMCTGTCAQITGFYTYADHWFLYMCRSLVFLRKLIGFYARIHWFLCANEFFLMRRSTGFPSSTRSWWSYSWSAWSAWSWCALCARITHDTARRTMSMKWYDAFLALRSSCQPLHVLLVGFPRFNQVFSLNIL